jgi:hypothetical protein
VNVNTINISSSQEILVNASGKTHHTGWSMVYPDGTSPGLLKARLRATSGLERLAGMCTELALIKARLYTPKGGWPTWGIEFEGTPISLPVGERLPLTVGRFAELTGWSAEDSVSPTPETIGI